MPSQHYAWTSGWEMKSIDLLELSTADIIEVCLADSRAAPDRSERLPVDLSTPERLNEALRMLCVVDSRVLAQTECEKIVQNHYPQDFDRDALRTGFLNTFPYLKKGRGSRKYRQK
jgi:hypothetical protein